MPSLHPFTFLMFLSLVLSSVDTKYLFDKVATCLAILLQNYVKATLNDLN